MMRFKFVNEGSRCETDITYGGMEDVNKLVDSYIFDREYMLLDEVDGDREYVNDIMKMEFGGITESCFCEIQFGEEDSVLIYLLSENSLEGVK